jgi:hypothetical protein
MIYTDNTDKQEKENEAMIFRASRLNSLQTQVLMSLSDLCKSALICGLFVVHIGILKVADTWQRSQSLKARSPPNDRLPL